MGTCGCDGTCECTPDSPYFGQFCELCSGSEICFENNCDSNRDCANCALDFIVEMMDVSVEEFFMNPLTNPDLPAGTTLLDNTVNNAVEVTLPVGYCSACPNTSTAVIISGSERADYIIDGESLSRFTSSPFSSLLILPPPSGLSPILSP